MLLKRKKCPNCGAYYDPTLEKCPGCHKHNELYLNREINDKIAFMHPVAQIGLFLGGFALTGMLLIELIISILFKDAIPDKDRFNAVLISCTYILMTGGLFFIIFFTRRNHFFSKYRRNIDYIYGLAYAITLVFVSSLVGNITSLFYQVTDNVNQSTAVIFSKNYPLLAFFVIGILGPVCEELTYRVGLYSFLRRINKYLALAITVIVFAFIHFDFDAADMVNELWSIPSYIAAGVVLTIAYEHRGPACSMVAHVLYNIFAFLMIFTR
ncbi:MAG: CPBP family intramembrane metalloprotease [Bacilli bacterium]|nr:CPBP family intramembrane metalloprotease [Bacilli bacterium]